MGFMAAALPYLAQAGMGAAGAAGGMAMQKAGSALFGGDAQNAMQPGVQPGGGPQGPQAFSILQALQQQMQQEEMMRQQALAQMLTSMSGPPPQQPIQMES